MELPQKLPAYLNQEAIESLILKMYRGSRFQREIHFDLSEVIWVSPMALSTFWCWLHELRKYNVKVRIIGAKGDNFAARFLATIGFYLKCKLAGIDVIVAGQDSEHFRTGRIASFETFRSHDDLYRFIDHVSSQDLRVSTLHAEQAPDFVLTGDFAGTVARELVENTLVHARAANSHLIVFEAEADNRQFRRSHPLFADFTGKGYIEIAVGDSGKYNLIETLRRNPKEGFEPSQSYLLPAKKRLTRQQETLLYAFQYGATSNPVAREAKIGKWFRSGEGKEDWIRAADIGTGLYSNLALARHYGGQLLVRTDGMIANLDFSAQSRDSERPRVTFQTGLAKLPGTIMVLRVPTAHTLGERTVGAKFQLDFSAETVECVGIGFPDGRSLTEGAQHVVRHYEKQLTALRREHAGKSNLLVGCSLDGIPEPGMVICGLLWMLARMPRHGFGLLVSVARPEVLGFIRSHWEQMKRDGTATSQLRYPSLVVAEPGGNLIEVYGAETDASATTVAGSEVRLPSGSRMPVRTALHAMRSKIITGLLTGSVVRHTDALFFIEGKYYTRKFYSIRALAERPHGRMVICYWLRDILEKLRPAAIVYGSRHTKAWLDAALAMPGMHPPSVFINAHADDVPTALHVAYSSAEKDRRVLILCDVICSSGFLSRFLHGYREPAELSIVCFVDARTAPAPFYSSDPQNQPVQIAFQAFHHDPIEPLFSRPHDFADRTLYVVDRETLELQQMNRWPAADSGKAETLFEDAFRGQALATGHYSHMEKHFVYVLNLPRAFDAWDQKIGHWLSVDEVGRWWKTQTDWAGKLVRVYCLSEETGLHKIAAAYLNDAKQWDVRPITRKELEALPKSTPAHKAKRVWFIIPAIAGGATLQACLEYAASVNEAEFVHVSAVFSRVDARGLRFYRQLTGYADTSKVSVNVMVHLALPTYSRNLCPICLMNEKLRTLQPSVTRSISQSLLQGLRQPVMELAAEQRSSASYAAQPADADLPAEAYLISQYTLGGDAISSVGGVLAGDPLDQAAAERFAHAIGRTHLSPEFLPERLEERFFSRKNLFDSPCQRWPWHDETDPERFRNKLRGFWRLAPAAMRSKMLQIAPIIGGYPTLLRVLLSEALLWPDHYWSALADTQNFLDPADARLVQEVFQSLRTAGENGGQMPLVLLDRLRVQFIRSSGWTYGLSRIEGCLSEAETNSIELAARATEFYRAGYDRVVELYNNIRASSLGENLQAILGDPAGSTFDSLKVMVATLKEQLREQPLPRQTIAASLAALWRMGQEMSTQIDNFCCVPWEPLQQAMQHATLRTSPVVQGLKIEVRKGCPSIAIPAGDLEQCFSELLSNAVKYAPQDKIRIVFERTTGAGRRVAVQYYQQAPWVEQPSRPPEGLDKMQQILARYDAGFVLNRHPTVSEPFICFQFHPWPLEFAQPTASTQSHEISVR